MTEERRKDYQEMHDDIKEIKEILVGKEGQNGLVGKVNFHDRYISGQISLWGIVVKTFLTSVIIIIVGIVALKIGVPHEALH